MLNMLALKVCVTGQDKNEDILCWIRDSYFHVLINCSSQRWYQHMFLSVQFFFSISAFCSLCARPVVECAWIINLLFSAFISIHTFKYLKCEKKKCVHTQNTKRTFVRCIKMFQSEHLRKWHNGLIINWLYTRICGINKYLLISCSWVHSYRMLLNQSILDKRDASQGLPDSLPRGEVWAL